MSSQKDMEINGFMTIRKANVNVKQLKDMFASPNPQPSVIQPTTTTRKSPRSPILKSPTPSQNPTHIHTFAHGKTDIHIEETSPTKPRTPEPSKIAATTPKTPTAATPPKIAEIRSMSVNKETENIGQAESVQETIAKFKALQQTYSQPRPQLPRLPSRQTSTPSVDVQIKDWDAATNDRARTLAVMQDDIVVISSERHPEVEVEEEEAERDRHQEYNVDHYGDNLNHVNHADNLENENYGSQFNNHSVENHHDGYQENGNYNHEEYQEEQTPNYDNHGEQDQDRDGNQDHSYEPPAYEEERREEYDDPGHHDEEHNSNHLEENSRTSPSYQEDYSATQEEFQEEHPVISHFNEENNLTENQETYDGVLYNEPENTGNGENDNEPVYNQYD